MLPTLLLATTALLPQNDAAPRPNILFLFSDDHAPHAIGAYGGPLAAVDPTPNIDRLAAQGMRFARSFCTNSICGPSRAVILTGKHSHRNGFKKNGDRFDGSQQTFPKLLQGAGYETAVLGKWHLGSDPQGFDRWEVLPGQGRYYNPEVPLAGGRAGDRRPQLGRGGRPGAGVAAGGARPREAVPPDVPVQGAASQLDARAATPRPVRRRGAAGAGHPVRPLGGQRQSRAASGDGDRPAHEPGLRPVRDAAGGLRPGQRTGHRPLGLGATSTR